MRKLLLIALLITCPAWSTELFQTPLYNDPSLVSYWRFEGNSLDSKGTKNGTDSNVIYDTGYGVFGQGVHFNGTSSGISTPDPVVTSGTVMTVSLWVLNGSAFQGGDTTIFSNQNDSTHSGIIFSQRAPANANQWDCFFGDGQGGWHGLQTGWFSLSTTQWTHVVCVIDGITRKVYVNGVLTVDDSPDNNGLSLSLTSASAFTFGKFPTANIRYFNGNIDDAAVFNRALNPTEVATLYNAQAHTYIVKDLGWQGSTPGGGAPHSFINRSGQVAGSGNYFVYGVTHGYLYSGGVATDLGSLGRYPTNSLGINDSGQVIGASTTLAGNTHAFLYSGGVMSDLGTLPGGSTSDALGINNFGQIVGSSTVTGGATHAFLYSSGQMTDLAPVLGGSSSSAYAINNSGDIVGSLTIPGGLLHAFLDHGGVVTDLGSLISNGSVNSTAYRINDHGQILIGSDIGGFTYNFVTATLTSIPQLSGGSPANISPQGMNNLGQAVGDWTVCCPYDGFLYTGGTTTNLNIPALPVFVLVAWDINDGGQIPVWAGEEYLLTPSTGTIEVTTNLGSATFSISGSAAYTGSGTWFPQPNAPPGSYTITFNPVAGYTTPAQQTQTLASGRTITFSGIYQPSPTNSGPPSVYVGNNIANTSNNVSVIDPTTNTVVTDVRAGNTPDYLAITPDGTRVYAVNVIDNTVSVISTATNTVVATVPVGINPEWVAITPDGTRAYVANCGGGNSPAASPLNTVSVINTASNTVVATVPVGACPYGVAITPDGTRAYVTDQGDTTVSVINTASNTVVATIVVGAPVGNSLYGVVITPDGSHAYVANLNSNNVSVIDTTHNTVVTTIPVGNQPGGVAITPDGVRVYVANNFDNTVSVISTATNTVTATIPVGTKPQMIAITPDGTRAYVANYNDNTVSVISTASNAVMVVVSGLNHPVGIAITPAATAKGSITVTSNLPAATFTITGPATYSGSGTSFTQANVPAGTYTITYGALPGYITPLSQTQPLLVGGAILFTGVYQALPANQSTSSLGTSSPSNPQNLTPEPVATGTGNYYSTHADLIVPGRGLPFVFTRSYNSADSYGGPLGPGWTHSFNLLLVQNPDNSVSIKQADGSVIGFAVSGGNYVATTPGVFDILQKHPDGSFTLTRKTQTQLNFSAAGRLLSVVDRNGNTQALAYNRIGNLIGITDSSSRLYALAYDGNSHLTGITDPIGRTLQYAYDTLGRLTSFHDPIGATTTYVYDSTNRLVAATDARGNVYVQNVYDAQGRVISQTNARNFTTTFAYNTPVTGTTTFTDPLGNATKDVYDTLGRFVQELNAAGGTTSYVYDSNNLKLSQTDPLGHVQSFTYDPVGNATSITDPAGKTSFFTYDNRNNPLTSKDRLGRVTTFTYDAKGNLLTTADPAGNTTTFTYDAFGEVFTANNARNFTTFFQYDAAGNLTKATNPLGGSVTMAYDGVGRLTSIQNQLGKTATRTYDAANRLLAVTDPLTNVTQFLYDGNGNLTKITDANGKQTQYAYDSTNKLVQVTDAIGGITQYQYNGNTDLTAVTDVAAHTTTYAYDALRRLSVVTDPLGRQKRYNYDAVSNVTGTVDGKGKTNTFGYDPVNRLVSMALSDGKSVAYAYDAVGNRTTMADWRGTSSYAYDLLNRAPSVVTPDGKAVGYTYDPVGNRTTLTYPDGKVAQYTYDGLNRLTKVTDSAAKSTSYNYDAAGNLTSLTHPNGAASTYQYDAANRLTSIVNRSGAATLSSFTYALDKVGNRLQMTTSAGGINQFGYDALYRLTSWTAPSGQVTQWTYDAVGNRKTTTSSAGTTNYGYDAADELLSAGATTFTYDGTGNQLTKTTGSTTLNYGWDALNRLISVTGGSASTQYQYDGDGNRVSQQVPSGTYAYVNDPAAGLPVVLNENGPDGNIAYLHGLSMVSATSTAFQYYHQFDGLGSTSNLTDPSGAQKANYSYEPWGKSTLPLDPVSKDKYKFTGEALDPGDGLLFLRARYYDPAVGRFVSKDPFSGMLTQPTSRNRYTYGLANPLRYSDSSGLSAIDGTGQVLGVSTPDSTAGDIAPSLLFLNPQNAATTPETLLQLPSWPAPTKQCGHDVRCNLLLNYSETEQVWSDNFGQQDSSFKQTQDCVDAIVRAAPLGIGTGYSLGSDAIKGDQGKFGSDVVMWGIGKKLPVVGYAISFVSAAVSCAITGH